MKYLSILVFFYWWEMSVTAKIGLEKKEKLDRFVTSLLLREGIKITLQKP